MNLERPISDWLPLSLKEAEKRGWDAFDVILISGDAYVDHPSFGTAVIGRIIESEGFRIGIVAQPNWKDDLRDFKKLGKPKYFFGVTAGCMDSMVNHYTANKRLRSTDAYTPGGQAGFRPDYASIVYSNILKDLFPDVPVLLGGIEASLRRVSHYDYWKDQLMPSILVDAKADLLVYGMGEQPLRTLLRLLKRGVPFEQAKTINQVAFLQDATADLPKNKNWETVQLASHEVCLQDKLKYAANFKIVEVESNKWAANRITQQVGPQTLVINPPFKTMTEKEVDGSYDLPYTRLPHPKYKKRGAIPAYDMIKFSVNTHRGCFGGCTFCSITEHEGRIIQSRSEDSVIREIEDIRDKVPGFTGVISDLGGPTANMYRIGCKSPEIESACRKPSCVYPDVCQNLNTDHSSLIHMYRRARAIKGVKKILIGSGLRYDLAVKSPEYIRELVTHHVGGYLKIAPEHTEMGPLSKMMKPGIGSYDKFKQMFDKFSAEAGKKQFLVPYFIAAHPGTSDKDMMHLAVWLKSHGFRADQVQTFYPSPMATATAMYHSGRNPLGRVTRTSETVDIVRGDRRRRLHKAFLRYHDSNNWPLLREALMAMGRSDLIGNGKKHLIPFHQPRTDGSYTSARRKNSTESTVRKAVTPGRLLTQHTGLPPRKK
jgi:uncharacterized radical SAM protein YgiQ